MILITWSCLSDDLQKRRLHDNSFDSLSCQELRPKEGTVVNGLREWTVLSINVYSLLED